ncbi:chemotaxis protein CheW [Enterococcus gallinarum]|uniref:Positive regulator of CheA protein activity (CheW) n=1 Tax=Enterococcus gallinarum TaxID=1353 RepID=A0A6G8F6N2_ENTGA|nr:chemotaxis protein CheW [Enterococcus gallinarum]MCR1945121.1 chemotaxis protein CheW [Enterococcus gallinarum]QIM11631.1 Positive regulator of CheA protein activity (CheW) [Enterococcus gallinarum]
MQMILFKMAQQHYLISAESVEEVIDAPEITKVPLAPEWVEGLINLRGTVLTVIRLSKLIAVSSSAEDRNVLIMKQGDDHKGVLVEEVIEVLELQESDLQLSDQEGSSHAIGVVSLSDKVASVIKIDQLIF